MLKNFYVVSLVIIVYLLTNQPAVLAGSELEDWCLIQGQSWQWPTCYIHSMATISSPLTIEAEEFLYLEPTGIIENFGILTNNGVIYTIQGASIINYDGSVTLNNGAIDINKFSTTANHGSFINFGTLSINGGFTNFGDFDSSGTINMSGFNSEYWNHGRLTNSGVFNIGSYSIFYISTNGDIYNYGSINSISQINNYGNFYNYNMIGTLYFKNYEQFFNSGTILNNYQFENFGDFYNFGSLVNNSTIENPGEIINYCSGLYQGQPPSENPILYFDNCAYFPVLMK